MDEKMSTAPALPATSRQCSALVDVGCPRNDEIAGENELKVVRESSASLAAFGAVRESQASLAAPVAARPAAVAACVEVAGGAAASKQTRASEPSFSSLDFLYGPPMTSAQLSALDAQFEECRARYGDGEGEDGRTAAAEGSEFEASIREADDLISSLSALGASAPARGAAPHSEEPPAKEQKPHTGECEGESRPWCGNGPAGYRWTCCGKDEDSDNGFCT